MQYANWCQVVRSEFVPKYNTMPLLRKLLNYRFLQILYFFVFKNNFFYKNKEFYKFNTNFLAS